MAKVELLGRIWIENNNIINMIFYKKNKCLRKIFCSVYFSFKGDIDLNFFNTRFDIFFL